jgi:hypothetical protein
MIRGARYNIQNDLAVFMRSRDVEQAEFVCAFAIIRAGNFDRVACIAKLDEFYALDDPSGFNVKTRYNSLCQHQYPDDYPKRIMISR